MKKWSVKKLVLTAILGGLAGVLMSLGFSLPFMPTFYKIDFSDVPSIIALFTMGPLSAACVEVIKIVVKIATVGSYSFGIGELANLIAIALFIIPTWLIYKAMGKTKKAVVASLFFGMLIRTGFACFVNAYITLPLYARAMGMPVDSIVKMVASVNPSITDLRSFILFATIPFNLIKIAANYGIGYFILVRLASARTDVNFYKPESAC
ncbi:ECF transporter S component [Catenisphaera adipataccumulans]|uniref:Riboflavin transporter n=1 Tax=Catenisphaera adipataccumulans TaxID=700500 RepID=A0A7W8CVQ3_9FIRM|nr:ECF transporter S component [Catenisphaera adipataccumulans]MBB5182460.1 riboflavin transporter FmnP [Catenisphaera adipataccumulans]